MIRNVLNTLGSFRSALAVGVGLPLLVAASASAQEPKPAEATTERVIVTGSYIPTAETESALPVTVYTAEVLQKQGANTPVEGLRQLPSFVGNAETENNSNGGNGQAFINLRALGTENTLTLVNGRRAFEFADINSIPIGALSRTEILKDGASAIYGSDAVAGVVNMVLLNGPGEKPYEGAEINALYGNTTDTDAHVRLIYVRGGVTGLDGKVAIAAAGEYYSRANLFSRDRDIATTGDTSNNPTGAGWGGLNNNSPTYGGRISVGQGAVTNLGFANSGELVLSDLTNNQVGPGSYRRFDVPAGTDPSRFNFREFTPAIPAMEKAMYYVTGRYKIFGEGLQLYGDIMYSHVKQDNGLAGAPFLISSAGNGLTEARASIFNPAGTNLASVRYRLQQELGNRKSFFDSDYYRYVAGINGDFNIKDNGFISRFGYDSGFVYEDFTQQRTDSGDATRSGIRAQILANVFNPFIGQFAPIVGTAPTYNPDGTPTGTTAAYDNRTGAIAASYLGHSFFFERDFLYDAKANMHLFPNLWNGGIDLALGYEHREIHLHSVSDPVQAEGDQLGFNQAPPETKTTQEVDSFFTELNLPLVTSTMNVPFVRSLELAFAWRYEKFDDRDDLTKQTASFDNVNEDENFGGTPRLSLRYQPIADVTLRASWGQSFRSPTPSSLFDPVSQNFPVLFDPFNPGGGVTLQPPLGVWQGGNTQLQPEKTDSYSAGVVWTPKFLPGFTMTVDWYQIFTTDLILDPASNAQVLLSANTPDPDGCGNGAISGECPQPPSTTGDGVGRNETGNLQWVDADFGNAGKRFVQGLDVTGTYVLPTERFGEFTLSGGWNHFFTWKAEADPTAGFHNFLGDYNNGTVPLAPGAIPFNKGFVRSEWKWRNFDFVMTGNYIGDFEDDPNFILGNDCVPGSAGCNDGTNPANLSFIEHRRVTSYVTLDMQLSYEFVKPAPPPPTYAKDSKDGKNVMQTAADTSSIWQRMLWGTTLKVGVVNAFDRSPPSVIGAFNDNYDTSLYSIRNRYYYVGVAKKF